MPEHFVDACGLAPPEPLLRLFAALDASAPCDRYTQPERSFSARVRITF
jgi:hypothetical protein